MGRRQKAKLSKIMKEIKDLESENHVNIDELKELSKQELIERIRINNELLYMRGKLGENIDARLKANLDKLRTIVEAEQ
jgi:hypothetical protein